MAPFETEVKFELPKGYVDLEGNVHKTGVMRLATAADEIVPLTDPRVKMNPGYLSVMLLTRVITKLGDLKAINEHVIESLFTADMSYLQNLYQSINAVEPPTATVQCPKCSHQFRYELPFFGEA